ncbi:GNAT family N-acetyltransferase [Neobacillus notoginsengisoli]|uniref:GNAT family N-acetyltransferase n=1 Tax=Neobacillus notoginsengisoli TaxID=1578198 RepID=A0A417YWG8_9BACI|nr:GNAT family N-acetyltransferase [Neobacillus notoginsengisoli]RHW41628.1 GNAT family N-acetyltransferase [Neobacillus notoginsengisoli]
MAIRKANQSETDYILRISGKMVQESTAGYAPNNDQNGYDLFLPLVQNGAFYLIDEQYRELRGWILLGSEWNSLTAKSIGHLLHLYVFPHHRSKGIAKHLMQAAIHDLYSRGIYTVQLNVFTGNPAKALYKKLGFRSISSVMELKLPKLSIGNM